MVELPEQVINHIKSFIPKDKDCKSPTVDVILPFIQRYKRLRYNYIRFTNFMNDPDYFEYEDYRIGCGGGYTIINEWDSVILRT